MTPDLLKRRLAAMPAALTTAVAPALDRVAEAVAAEAARALADGHPRLAAAIVTGRDGDRAVLTVPAPGAAELEYGTRREAARPFVRPAIAATADGAHEILAGAVRQALAGDSAP